MWLQPRENTVDCLISYNVAATTDVLRLQKKSVAKPSMWVIATLSQCDCTLSAVWLQKKQLQKQHVTTIAKKTVAKTQVKKCDCKKTSSKKSSMSWHCQMRLGWCLLDVVATWWKYRWLQHPLHVVATTDVLWLQKRQLQNQNVGDCNLVAVWLHPYSSVIVIAKKQVKSAIAINQFKKPPCHDTVRLRLG
jgi:hypothetical protein